MNGLRPEYQERINFVILDVDLSADRALAREMGASVQPFFAVVPPNRGPESATRRTFGPLTEQSLRQLIEGALATYLSVDGAPLPPDRN